MAVIRTHIGMPDDAGLLARWDALVVADPLGTFFHTSRYLGLWARVLGTRATVHVHEVVEGDTTIGIIPVALQREGSATGPMEVVRFLGGDQVTDYLGPVALPEHRGVVANTYLSRLAEDGDWDEFVAGGVVVGSGWEEHWRDAASALGLVPLEAVQEDVCPRIDLSDGYGAYLDGLPSKLRHELRRKARKLSRDAGEYDLVEVPLADHGEALERFFEMNVEAGDEKGRFFANDEMRVWFRALASELGADKILRIHELHVGGTPGAACVSIVHGGEWGLYNSAFDPALGMLAPGMVIVGELIEMAANEGLAVFDLLRGDEPYKYRFGPVDRELVSATFHRA
ncbi:MAG: CelD/BcsL family acetyltransferase involved in cellulose biosynthesis [Myxococcota bacterium]